MSQRRVLIYILRHDLRITDNPIFHHAAAHYEGSPKQEGVSLSKPSSEPFTHFLPLYIFNPSQIEVSGLAKGQSPFPPAKSRVGGFWRMGRKRSRFLLESLWDLKHRLSNLGSRLELRVGRRDQVVGGIVEQLVKDGFQVTIWMTKLWASEELSEESAISEVARQHGAEITTWVDEGYLIDDRDIPYKAEQIPDVFTSFRKGVEPLRENVRDTLSAPEVLPPIPDSIPPQSDPFSIPDNMEAIIEALHKPLLDDPLSQEFKWPEGAIDSHPWKGGETRAQERLEYLISSGAAIAYKDTRNGLIGEDYSCKMSAYLAIGCISARQMHHAMYAFEEGNAPRYSSAPGYGKGQNKGTAAIRFELLWRDYMRHCGRKFGRKMFYLYGFRNSKIRCWDSPTVAWEGEKMVRTHNKAAENTLQRWLRGKTGISLVDASMKEIYLTGYTSNRARQNVASFLAKHVNIDWRIGAEYYESILVDYDVFSNWANWQYLAGVGNDPRGEGRLFNPVKQAFDYDPEGAFVKMWIPELKSVDDIECVFQPWKLSHEEKKRLGIAGEDWVERPLKQIQFTHGLKRRRKDFPKVGVPDTHSDSSEDSGPDRGRSRGRGRGKERKNRGGHRDQARALGRERSAMEEDLKQLLIL